MDGVTLRELLRARRLRPDQALAIVPPLCEALQFAHERGIIHRDIKPENLLLAKAGQIKVTDLGIARILGDKQRFGTILIALSILSPPWFTRVDRFDAFRPRSK